MSFVPMTDRPEPTDCFPEYSKAERAVDMAVHAIGMTAAVPAVAVLFAVTIPDSGAATLLCLALYAFGLLSMLSFSALYNIAAKTKRKEMLRRLDHAAIFIMIAGTYTPFAALTIKGTAGTLLLVWVWGLALAGVALKILRPHRLERLALALYLGLGWSVLPLLDHLRTTLPANAFLLLLAGGIVYTCGVVFHLWSRLRFSNAVWHIFVLAGAICHYAAIMDVVA